MIEPEIAAAEAMEASALDDPDSVDLNGEPTQSRLSGALGRLPYLLSSRIVIVFGIVLFFYLSCSRAWLPCSDTRNGSVTNQPKQASPINVNTVIPHPKI